MKRETFKAGKMWENSGEGLSRNHCCISSTGQGLALMKLRWLSDREPQGSPCKAALGNDNEGSSEPHRKVPLEIATEKK